MQTLRFRFVQPLVEMKNHVSVGNKVAFLAFGRTNKICCAKDKIYSGADNPTYPNTVKSKHNFLTQNPSTTRPDFQYFHIRNLLGFRLTSQITFQTHKGFLICGG